MATIKERLVIAEKEAAASKEREVAVGKQLADLAEQHNVLAVDYRNLKASYKTVVETNGENLSSVRKLELNLKTAKDSSNTHYNAFSQLNQAVSQVHDVLDAVGCPVPKRSKDAYQDMPLAVRVAAMMTILPRIPNEQQVG